MKTYLITILAVVVAFAAGIGPAAAQENQLNQQDREFMQKAAQGNLMEIRLGEMATQNAASEEVKSFGQRMVLDHSQALEKLKQVAQQTDVSLPVNLSLEKQQTVDRFSGLSGEEFDREYMALMEKEHKKDIDLFQKEVQQGQHPEVTQYAANVLDTLQQHRELAQNIDSSMTAQAGATGSAAQAGQETVESQVQAEQPADAQTQAEQPADAQTQAEQPADAQTQAAQLQTSQADQWIGRQVIGKGGDQLGTIRNNYLSADGEKVLYVIVQGEGDQLHPIPGELLQESADKPVITAEIDKETFDQSPSFTGQPALHEPRWSNEIRSYYRDFQETGR